MREFCYVGELDFPLFDEVELANEGVECFVANSPLAKAQVVASEVDFYIKNSKDEPLKMAQNVSKIYKARAAIFDNLNAFKGLYTAANLLKGETVALDACELASGVVPLFLGVEKAEKSEFGETSVPRAPSTTELFLIFATTGAGVVGATGAGAALAEQVCEKIFGARLENVRVEPVYFDEKMNEQELLAHYLAKFVGGGEFGRVESELFGEVGISEGCTMCACCVGACESVALRIEERAITFNASLCNACGECEKKCAEKGVLTLKTGLTLAPSSFKWIKLFEDEAFCCAQCGVEFAPKKAILKVAALLGDKAEFAKMCGECKAKKAAFSSYLNDF